MSYGLIAALFMFVWLVVHVVVSEYYRHKKKSSRWEELYNDE